MRELSDVRMDIDAVDDALLEMFERRLALSDEVAAYKRAHDRAVYDPVREKEKLDELKRRYTDAFMGQAAEELFTQLMSLSRKKQYRDLGDRQNQLTKDFTCVENFDFSGARVAFQGVSGAYSEMAARTFFHEDVTTVAVETWRDAFRAIRDKKADYAVIPVENSTAGTITETYDLLLEFEANIIGEQIIAIRHALLGLKGASPSDIRTVYSHPQALRQCTDYLRSRHPDVVIVELKNTAMSAKKVCDDGDITAAAIAGEHNAKLYGLCVLDNDIQDVKGNETRFIIISDKNVYRRSADKLSICMELPHEKGSLYRALSHIMFNGLNMTHIESRPMRSRGWEYRFFIDFEGNLNDQAVRNALCGLQEEVGNLRILGNY